MLSGPRWPGNRQGRRDPLFFGLIQAGPGVISRPAQIPIFGIHRRPGFFR